MNPKASCPGWMAGVCGPACRVWHGRSLCLLLAMPVLARAQGEMPRDRDLNQPIVVAVSEATFPYSFRDKDGQLKGFANDVGTAVAQVMHLKIRREVLSPPEMGEALRTGRVDMIQWWGETDERRTWVEFSVPIARFETVAVVRKGDSRIKRLADLKGKRVACGQRGSVGWNYLVHEQPEATPVLTETTEEYLRLLAAGGVDAAVLSRLTAVSALERFKLKNLTVLDDRIPGEKYDVRYCFTVRRGDSLLLARLNEGLGILHRTGEFDRIYRECFGRYESSVFTREQVVNYSLVALAVLCVAATGAFLRQRALSRRIARQAAELAQQRSLLAALHDKHPLATVVIELPVDGSVRLVSANHEAARLFSLGPETKLPLLLQEVPLAAHWRAHLEEAVRHWRETGQLHQWETTLTATQQLLEASVVPLGRDEAGTTRLCVLTADVTKRRLMDQEVAQSRRLRALGELVGGIAHEFNNLLTPVLMTTSFARSRDTADPESREGFAVIEQAAVRAADLTRRLLTFGRKVDERAQPVRLADAVNNCFALLRPTVDRRIVWSFQPPRDLPVLQLNPTDLSQIVFNLVINARDTLLDKLAHPPDATWTPQLRVSVDELPAAEGPQRVTPETRTPVAWQRLTVEDNGRGIAPGIVDRIFEPFFTTKEVGQGTGLGLATVWHLVTDAGGEVTVESTPGKGSRFHVLLPRWGARVPPSAGHPAAPVATVETPGRRVLLVEDEPLIASAAMALLRQAGHLVTHQPDGAEAWAYLSTHAADCDLLLADVNMPRMNGVDLVRRARENGFRGRILMISGRVTPEERRALDELGIDGMLNKPFTGDQLQAAVQKVLRVSTAKPVRAI